MACKGCGKAKKIDPLKVGTYKRERKPYRLVTIAKQLFKIYDVSEEEADGIDEEENAETS